MLLLRVVDCREEEAKTGMGPPHRRVVLGLGLGMAMGVGMGMGMEMICAYISFLCVTDSAQFSVRGGLCLLGTMHLQGWAVAPGRAPRIWLVPIQQSQGALLTP